MIVLRLICDYWVLHVVECSSTLPFSQLLSSLLVCTKMKEIISVYEPKTLQLSVAGFCRILKDGNSNSFSPHFRPNVNAQFQNSWNTPYCFKIPWKRSWEMSSVVQERCCRTVNTCSMSSVFYKVKHLDIRRSYAYGVLEWLSELQLEDKWAIFQTVPCLKPRSAPHFVSVGFAYKWEHCCARAVLARRDIGLPVEVSVEKI